MRDSTSGVYVQFKVKKQWKGGKQTEFTVVWDGPGVCGGFLFEKFRTYLVYAHGKKMLVYTDCDRTAKVENARDDIRKLNSSWFRFYARLIPF